MHNLNLFKTLLGIPAEARFEGKMREMEPDEQSFCFSEAGYVMEYIELEPDKKKIVSLFFGAGECVVRCHPELSKISSLTELKAQTLTHGQVFRTLRMFPESRNMYKGTAPFRRPCLLFLKKCTLRQAG